MYLCPVLGGVLGAFCLTSGSGALSIKGRHNSAMACSSYNEGREKLPGPCWILSVHSEVCHYCGPIGQSHNQRTPSMDIGDTGSLWHFETCLVNSSSVSFTGLRPSLHSWDRCVRNWYGCHSFTARTPHSILQQTFQCQVTLIINVRARPVRDYRSHQKMASIFAWSSVYHTDWPS